jgi:MFS family permease
VGPSLSGIALTAAGAALCFSMNGLSFLVVIASLYMVNVRFLPQKSTEPVLSAMKQGFGFISNRPGMKPLILLSFTITFLGFQIMAFLPPMARQLQGGSTTMAFLSVSSGVGAVTGALIVAAIGRSRHQGRNSLLALMVLGLTTTGYAFAPNVPVACALLFLAGISLMAVFNMNTSLVQMLAPDDMRGRVMSVYNLSVRGGQAIGPLVAGSLITNYGLGPRNVIAGCGVLLLCVGLYLFTFNRRITEL